MYITIIRSKGIEDGVEIVGRASENLKRGTFFTLRYRFDPVMRDMRDMPNPQKFNIIPVNISVYQLRDVFRGEQEIIYRGYTFKGILKGVIDPPLEFGDVLEN